MMIHMSFVYLKGFSTPLDVDMHSTVHIIEALQWNGIYGCTLASFPGPSHFFNVVNAPVFQRATLQNWNGPRNEATCT